MNKVTLFIGVLFFGLLLYVVQVQYQKQIQKSIPVINTPDEVKYSKIVFAGGCFWSTEAEFNHIPGVVSAVSGFTGGDTLNPSYTEVSSGSTTHREAVIVYYNDASTTIDKLLVSYWKHIDPTDTEGQFVDRGHQYTTAIYYTTDLQMKEVERSKQMMIDAKKFTKGVATEILPYKNFYPAEEYHQNYKDKNPVRYEYYRNGSGRNNFIEKNWKNDTTTFSQLMTNTTMNTNNSITSKSSQSWTLFITPSDETLRRTLTDEQYKVTQKEGTERPFANAYNNNKEKGIYVDIVSGEPLYLSVDKYDSGTGWPSFVKPIDADAVTLKKEDGIFSSRTEVRSKIANSHLGHVFNDGPSERGGMRYCMNSASMKFIRLADMEKEGYAEYVHQIQ